MQTGFEAAFQRGGDLTRVGAVWLLLLLWSMSAHALNCFGSSMFLLLLWLLSTRASLESAWLRRHAFVNQYLAAEGTAARLLSGKTFMMFFQGGKALFPGFLLAVSVLSFDTLRWWVFLADALLLVMLVVVIERVLRHQVRSVYLLALSRYWAHRLNTLLLWLMLVAAAFFSAHHNYQGMSWEQAARFGASSVTVPCDALGVLVRTGGLVDALSWWAAQQLLSGVEQPAQRLAAWLFFTGFFGVSMLVAWSYSRALTGALAAPLRLFSATSGAIPKI